MSSRFKVLACLSGIVSPAVLGAAMSLVATGAMADCTGPGAPSTGDVKCFKAVAITGNPLRSFDISWVNPNRGQYYLGDRSNSGIDIINTRNLKFERTIGGFVGIKTLPSGAVDNNHSGPDGVTSHGRWLYGGDGNSTLHVIDLDAPKSADPTKQIISTGGTTRVDEMALTTDGRLLLAANNAEDPPFATLFTANGDDAISHVSIITQIKVDPSIIPAGAGLSLEQPAWDPQTKRFLTSIPIVANNPPGCEYGQTPPPGKPITCRGGVLVTDPTTLTKPNAVQGAFNPATNTGVVLLQNNCGPNGSSVGPDDEVLLGCNPGNNPTNVILDVINATTKAETAVNNITGADEVWYNSGDNRYYTGSSRDCSPAGTPCGAGEPGKQVAVLGVIDANTNLLIEKIPQSSGSHSVAADSRLNRIFVPQVAPFAIVGSGGDTTAVGAGICGTNNGCIAVYKRIGKGHDDEDDQGEDHGQNAQN
jgi:hypothetical protein